MLQETVKQSIKANHFTASEKIDVWNQTYDDVQIRTELLKVKALYPEYANKAYYPENPFFPKILDLPYFNDEQATLDFIHLFFPQEIAQAYERYISEKN